MKIRSLFIPSVFFCVSGLNLSAQAVAPSAKPPTVTDPALKLELLATYPDVEACTTVVGAPDGSVYVGNDVRDSRLNTAKPECTIVRLAGTARTVFADQVYSPAGMAWFDGWLYVIHDPLMTRFKDTNGDGVADLREDLITNLGLAPNEGLNDHVVTGFTLGMDGFFYISVGDRGIYRAKAKDGSEISLEGGGIVRCRPDGTKLEIFSTGSRNHLEVNLDAEDHAFTLDNTDDGNGWWTRLTHHVEGGFYGYPHHFKHDQANGLLIPGPSKPQFEPGAPARNERFLPAMTDFGGGSPTGGLCYLSDGLPEAYRGRQLFSEWGKGHVTAIEVVKDGASFKFLKNTPIVQGGNGAEFRPMQLSVAADGSLLIADWQWSGWKGPKTVGSVWRLSWPEAKPAPRLKDETKASVDELLAALNHVDRDQRLRAEMALITKGTEVVDRLSALVKNPQAAALPRMHALWALENIAIALSPEAAAGTSRMTSFQSGGMSGFNRAPVQDGANATKTVQAPAAYSAASLRIAAVIGTLLKDKDPSLRAQAVRALAAHRLENHAAAFLPLLDDSEASVRLQAITALGRLGDEGAPPVRSIAAKLADKDLWVRFATTSALRRINQWTAFTKPFESGETALAEGLSRALTGLFDPAAVEWMIRASQPPAGQPADSANRQRALELLGTVAYQPKPWTGHWWGTQPVKAEAPPNSLAWKETPKAIEALTAALVDADSGVRLAAAKALAQGVGPEALPRLRARLSVETDPAVRRQLIMTLGIQRDPEALNLFSAIALDAKADPDFQKTAIVAVETIGGSAAQKIIAQLVGADLTPATLREVIAAALRLKVEEAAPALIARLHHPDAAIRELSVKALAAIGPKANAAEALLPLLEDKSPQVQQESVITLGLMKNKVALPQLLALFQNNKFRKEALSAIVAMPDPQSIPTLISVLNDRNSGTRRLALGALNAMRDLALPLVEEKLASGSVPKEFEAEIRGAFNSGAITNWKMIGPFENVWAAVHPPEKDALSGGDFLGKKYVNAEGHEVGWTEVTGDAEKGQVDLEKVYKSNGMVCAYAFLEIEAPEAADAKLLAGSDDQIAVWLNGHKLHNYPGARGYRPDQDEVPIHLVAGKNQLFVKIGNAGGRWEFGARIPGLDGKKFVKSKEPTPEMKQQRFALATNADGSWVNAGDPVKGAKIFADQNGPIGGICASCHAVGGKGGQTAPDLSAIAVNYKRSDLVTSIHEPSKSIALGFEQVLVETKKGETFVGSLRSETADGLTLVGADAQPRVINKAEVKTQTHVPTSLMPQGLTTGLQPTEFADLLAYLETLRGK